VQSERVLSGLADALTAGNRGTFAGGSGSGATGRNTSMADEEQNTSGGLADLVQEFMGQLQATNDRLQDLGRFGASSPPARGGLALPGAFSAAQMAALTDSVAAQRHSIETLRTQLSLFDEQLAALEQILGPFAEWSKTWADFEQRLLSMGLGPEAGK
jgi:hypothetical protein